MSFSGTLSAILNSNPNQANARIVVGNAQTIPNTNIIYQPVYNPATRETVIIRQTLNNGAPTQLDMNQRIATLGPNNRWIPTDYARSIGGQPLINSITSTAGNSAAASFNRTRDDVIRNSGTNNQQLSQNAFTSARRPADSAAPSMTTTTNTLGTSRTGSSPPPAPGGNSPPPDGTPPTGAAPSAADQTENARGSGSVSANREAGATAITTLAEVGVGTAVGSKVSDGDLKYPLSFPENMDSILFTAKSYGTRTFSPSTFGFSPRNNTSTGNTVKLPIQVGISDANTVGWNEETFNPAQVAGAQLAISGITEGGEGFINQVKNITKKMADASTDLEKAIIAYFTEQAIGVQVLPKLSGAIFNPNTELLFQGPQLRSFNFSFRFTPRSSKESLEVKKIIRFFKSNMAAQTSTNELFLKAPNVFQIDFLHSGTKGHSGISLIKECALQACNVDYTPDGTYMSFKDGGMVSYTMNLQFMELEPIYAKDYDGNHPIGY